MQTYVYEENAGARPYEEETPLWEGDLDLLPGGIHFALPGESFQRALHRRWARLDGNQRATQLVVVGKGPGEKP